MSRHKCSDQPGTCGHTIVVEGPPPLDPLARSLERLLDEAVALHKRARTPASQATVMRAARAFAQAVRRG